MTNAIVLGSADSAVVHFAGAKGSLQSISAEGAVFKGGKALRSFKDMVLDLALNKANNGKYRAAADIIGTAFPSVQKSFVTIIGEPYKNKSTFASFLGAVARVQEPMKGWSKKQIEARELVAACASFVCETDEVVQTIDG